MSSHNMYQPIVLHQQQNNNQKIINPMQNIRPINIQINPQPQLNTVKQFIPQLPINLQSNPQFLTNPIRPLIPQVPASIQNIPKLPININTQPNIPQKKNKSPILMQSLSLSQEKDMLNKNTPIEPLQKKQISPIMIPNINKKIIVPSLKEIPNNLIKPNDQQYIKDVVSKVDEELPYEIFDNYSANSIINNPYLEYGIERDINKNNIINFPEIKTIIEKNTTNIGNKLINSINIEKFNSQKTDFGISLDWDIITDEGIVSTGGRNYVNEKHILPKTLSELKNNIHKITGEMPKNRAKNDKAYSAGELQSLIIFFKCGKQNGKKAEKRATLIDFINSADGN